jgi:hypothetical protein
MSRGFFHRCPQCHTEIASANDSESCPECGTEMASRPNRAGIVPHPKDPRYQKPRANRLPPPTGRNQFPA